MFYYQDTSTGKQQSLKTTDKIRAPSLLCYLFASLL